MNPLIGVSTQCLYYWADNSKWMTEQLRIIDILCKHATRLELYFGVEDILACNDKILGEYAERIAGNKCSLHLPSFSDDIKDTDILINKAREIVKRLSIEYCILHADEYVLLKLKVFDIKLGLRFGLENSDIRKFGFQHLRDLQIFDLPVVVDVDHIEETKSGSFDEELKALHNSILGIHFSTPHSSYFDSLPEIKTTHFPFARSGSPLPKNFPKNVPIVIEGVIPPKNEALLDEEILLIKNTYF